MPLRFLTYISKIFRELIHNKNIFGSKLIKIPNPRFVVFYNGTDDFPERVEYKLSDAFENLRGEPSLELKCLCININPGYNENIKNECEGLMGYTRYIEMVRENSKTMNLEDAVKSAVDRCISENILGDFFMKNRKIIITDDPIDGTFERREWFAKQEGIEEERARIIENALRRGNSPQSVSEFNGIPLDEVLKVHEQMLKEA